MNGSALEFLPQVWLRSRRLVEWLRPAPSGEVDLQELIGVLCPEMTAVAAVAVLPGQEEPTASEVSQGADLERCVTPPPVGALRFTVSADERLCR